MTGTLVGGLPNNLLPVADSDFESALTGNWTATNATLTQSAAQAFTGTHSLLITATATATVTVSYTPKLAGLATTPMVFSGWMFTPQTSITAQTGTQWFTGGGASISTVYGTSVALAQNTWTPVTARLAAPATSSTQSMSWQITGLANTQTVSLDLVFDAPSLWQILAALATSPLSTSPVYADLTPYVRADQGFGYSGRGRGDEVNQVQAGTGQFVLDNQVIPGGFAPGNTNSPFTGWQTGRLVQMNAADETGAWHTRYTGFITDIDLSWQGGPGLESMAAVTAQDIFGWLGRKNTMRTMIEEEILLDTPQSLYTLADASGSTTASDSSGNASPTLQLRKYGSNGTMAFASSGVIGFQAEGFTTSPLQAALFTPAAALAGNWQLEGLLSAPVSASAGWTFEVWYNATPITATGIAFTLSHQRTGQQIGVSANTGTGWFLFYAITGMANVSSAVFHPPTEGTMVLEVSGTTATLYINNSSVATITVPAAVTADYLTLGGPMGGASSSGPGGGWSGTLSCAAIYPGVQLSSGRRTAHFSAGANQNQGAAVSTVAANVLTYAGIPSALVSMPSPSVSNVDAFEISGQTPLSMLQSYQQVDGGVFYVSAAGVITMQDRAARYAAQVTPALVLAGGQYQENLEFDVTTQFQVNDATLSNNNISGGVRAINAPAVAAAGTFASGDPQSPVSGPWYSFPYTPQPNGTIANSDVLADTAQYQVNIYGTPAPRSPAVTIDLASQPGGGTTVSRASCYGVDVGSVLQLTNLPAAGPGGTRMGFLYAEGLGETFQRDDTAGVTWTLSLNTSPALQSEAWIAGDANLGVLDSTAVVGRSIDGTTIASPFQYYVGPPYQVPNFTAGLNRTGYVGANDLRGLTYNTYLNIHPPCAAAEQLSLSQSIANSTNTVVQFDTLLFDTWNGWNLGSSNSQYVVQYPGIYLLLANIVFAGNGAGDRWAWFTQNGTTITQENEHNAFAGQPNGVFVSAQIVCQPADVLKVNCAQTSGGALNLVSSAYTGVQVGGCFFSVLWLGA